MERDEAQHVAAADPERAHHAAARSGEERSQPVEDTLAGCLARERPRLDVEVDEVVERGRPELGVLPVEGAQLARASREVPGNEVAVGGVDRQRPVAGGVGQRAREGLVGVVPVGIEARLEALEAADRGLEGADLVEGEIAPAGAGELLQHVRVQVGDAQAAARALEELLGHPALACALARGEELGRASGAEPRHGLDRAGLALDRVVAAPVEADLEDRAGRAASVLCADDDLLVAVGRAGDHRDGSRHREDGEVVAPVRAAALRPDGEVLPAVPPRESEGGEDPEAREQARPHATAAVEQSSAAAERRAVAGREEGRRAPGSEAHHEALGAAAALQRGGQVVEVGATALAEAALENHPPAGGELLPAAREALHRAELAGVGEEDGSLAAAEHRVPRVDPVGDRVAEAHGVETVGGRRAGPLLGRGRVVGFGGGHRERAPRRALPC